MFMISFSNLTCAGIYVVVKCIAFYSPVKAQAICFMYQSMNMD
jgi:hypothetical protein